MNEFKLAWNAWTRRDLPVGSEPGEPAKVLAFIPVVGLVVGVGCWLIAELARLLVGKPLPAGFVGAVAVMAFYGWTVRGGRLKALAELGTIWEIGYHEKGGDRLPGGLRIPQLLCLGWLAATLIGVAGLIAYSGARLGTLWLVVPPVLAATAYTDLNNRKSASAVPAYCYWPVAMAIVVLTGALIGRITVAILALTLTWIVGSGSFRLPGQQERQEDAWPMIAMLESVVLWIGLLGL